MQSSKGRLSPEVLDILNLELMIKHFSTAYHHLERPGEPGVTFGEVRCDTDHNGLAGPALDTYVGGLITFAREGGSLTWRLTDAWISHQKVYGCAGATTFAP
jgi:hypothetical protein